MSARHAPELIAVRAVLARLAGIFVIGIAGCAGKAPTPEWQVEAHDALGRYENAHLTGRDRVAAAEFDLARRNLAATGQPTLVARAELTRCAMQVASLAFVPCTGLAPLRADAAAAERAYADYLEGRVTAGDAALLPPAHRAIAGALAQGRTVEAAQLRAIEDPLARLIAAGVALRMQLAAPDVLAAASEAASAQGWRRPLLAWLGAQAMRAEGAGAADEAQRLRRRMALVESGSAPAANPPRP